MFFFKSKNFWDDFFINYSNLIYSAIRRTFLHYNYQFTNEDIEDCYSSISIKILSQKKQIENNFNEEKSKFTTYLSVLCTNRTIDYLNANKYKYLHVDVKESLLISNDDNLMLDIDKFLESNLLSDREKLVLKLFYMKELSSREISKILNISDNTVRVTKKKAIDKLKEEYNNELS